MNSNHYDMAIIGGGIVGLATALALSERFPSRRLVVFEKEPHVGSHQTGHNSGVIHSGIYYHPNSYKAKFCLKGARLLMNFCKRNGIPYERCGKVIVATDEHELPYLEVLYERGLVNGVSGLEMIGPGRLKEIEPHASALRALYSPHAGIVDFSAVARAMQANLERRGVEILTNTQVLKIHRTNRGLHFHTKWGEVQIDYFVNSGGLYSDTIARMAGAQPSVRIIPFRGEYYLLRPKRRHLVRGLIYPVPDPKFPFLGVHFTKTIHGDVEAGPNAVLAFAREGYRMSEINLGELMGTLGYQGFWAMVGRYWKTGCYEFYRSLNKKAFMRVLQKLVPDLRDDDLVSGGAGVRAQAVSLDGSLLNDFSILQTENAIHILNAPSPAATASLAIGQHIATLTK